MDLIKDYKFKLQVKIDGTYYEKIVTINENSFQYVAEKNSMHICFIFN